MQVLVLENVRFHKEETKNEPEFAKKVSCWKGHIALQPCKATLPRALHELSTKPQLQLLPYPQLLTGW